MTSDRFVFDGKNIYDNLEDKYLESVWEIVEMLNLLNETNVFNRLQGGY